MIVPVKIVTQVKLMPEADQAAALRSTLRTANDLACWVLRGGVRPRRAA